MIKQPVRPSKVGDIVRLGVSGPLMTITQVYPDSSLLAGYAEASWFNYEGKLNYHNFPVAALQVVENE